MFCVGDPRTPLSAALGFRCARLYHVCNIDRVTLTFPWHWHSRDIHITVTLRHSHSRDIHITETCEVKRDIPVKWSEAWHSRDIDAVTFISPKRVKWHSYHRNVWSEASHWREVKWTVTLMPWRFVAIPMSQRYISVHEVYEEEFLNLTVKRQFSHFKSNNFSRRRCRRDRCRREPKIFFHVKYYALN